MFEEVQVIGSKRVVKIVEAKQFPEMNFIHDLIYNYSSRAEEITAEQYEAIKS